MSLPKYSTSVTRNDHLARFIEKPAIVRILSTLRNSSIPSCTVLLRRRTSSLEERIERECDLDRSRGALRERSLLRNSHLTRVRDRCTSVLRESCRSRTRKPSREVRCLSLELRFDLTSLRSRDLREVCRSLLRESPLEGRLRGLGILVRLVNTVNNGN